MRKNIVFVIVMAILFMANSFGQESDFLFLKDIQQKVDAARQAKDVQSLCAYAALLFYNQNCRFSSEKIEKDEIEVIDQEDLSPMNILRNATLIAWRSHDLEQLRAVRVVWASKVFGPADKAGVKEIEKLIHILEKNNVPFSANSLDE